ncbi:pirin family protein [Glaciimonas sp. PCH181]|uniref:pirin family protein n=1 Tax=Glaciimonas sp. PCH181 TaxID=2133943 RepID=UPI000D33231A|nr:pirin-like C-terminal cupin domain-containing protein [Glaciimonas sp. PCH181]PUA20392.1 pirin family protein [Glaciimonas sp. PCH181]
MHKKHRISKIVAGHDMHIGAGFQAKHFGENSFDGLVDPLVMLDHFHMRQPTFDPHPHAGISAVTYMFEDSTSPHINYDSLGNTGPINPGDLHWMVAGSGVVHTEQPEGKNPLVHALQIFVNLPSSKKFIAPHAVHVDAADIPEFSAPGLRVRVVTGEFQGLCSPAILPEPYTLLDGFLAADGVFEHTLQEGWNAMVYVVQGIVNLNIGGEQLVLTETNAIGLSGAATVVLTTNDSAHVVILSGPALNEPLIKHGPFVMSTTAQMHDRLQAYRDGKFGELNMPAPAVG